MNDLRTAAQQALESLEWHLERGAWGADIEGVTGALRAALEQQPEPAQEPVAWEDWWRSHGQYNFRATARMTFERAKELMKLAFEVGREAAPQPQQAEPYPLPDDLYDSTDWRAGTYAERVEWLHAMYESAKKERDALLYPPEPLWPATGLEPRGCPLPGACSCPSESVRSTHSAECWRWHHACAVAEIERLKERAK